jgi:peptidoglycan/LPS O-acetylase OafA/YrhL
MVANDAALLLMTTVAPQNLIFFVYYWFPNALPVFACGSLTYHPLPLAPTDGRLASLLLAAMVLLLLYCAWGPIPWYSSVERPMSRSLLTGLATVFLAVPLAGTHMPWLVNRAICFVGKISFSACLLHFLVVFPLADYVGPIHASGTMSVVLFGAALLVVMGVTVGLSSLTYRIIERPCIQAGSRFVRCVIPVAG